MYLFLEVTIKVLSYVTIFYMLWLLIGEPFLQVEIDKTFRKWKRKRTIKRLSDLEKDDEEESSNTKWFYNHLNLLLSSTSKSEKQNQVTSFVFQSLLLFIVTLLVIIFTVGDFIYGLFIGVSIMVVPYIFKRLKLISYRLETSLAFMQNYHVILQSYQRNDGNIYYMIRSISKEITDDKLKLAFVKLLSSLQKNNGQESIKEAIYLFTYSINSVFSKRFATLLQRAYLDNRDIRNSLINLDHDIKKRFLDLTKEKTFKSETVLLGIFPIPLLILMLIGSYNVTKIVDYWTVFLRPLPMFIFSLCILFTVFVTIATFIIQKPRADL